MSERNADAGQPSVSSVTDGGTPDLNEFLRILNDRRRRCVLYCLRQGDVRERGTLARHIAARLDRTSPGDVPERRSDQIETALAHTDLPMLAAVGVISYDRRTGSLEYGDPPEPLEALVDACASFDEFAHSTDSSDGGGVDTPSRDG